MVVKPRGFVVRGKKGLIQPALTVRGREYLRIIYGPEYDAPEHLERLRERGLAGNETWLCVSSPWRRQHDSRRGRGQSPTWATTRRHFVNRRAHPRPWRGATISNAVEALGCVEGLQFGREEARLKKTKAGE